jgi:curli production assembly/transport component CsgG
MKKLILSLSVLGILTGCATGSAIYEKATGQQFDEPVIEQNGYLKKDTNKLLPPQGGPIPVAVYGFTDKTGQRKSLANIASLSSAVTQGAESYLIKSLQDVGDARWFTVLERVGLDNLIKERQMIRQMREQYQGKDAKPLPPMMFAGIILEGGIIGYDSNTLTGGSGVRIFGIGAQTQYQSDTVTINLRTVSVSSGEVLTSVTVTKTVLSYMDKFGVLKFVDSGTTSVEGEVGGSINESINKATIIAIQAAVVDTIREGARKGHWAFLETKPEVKVVPAPVLVPAPVVIEETKKEEKKDELVQPQTPKAPERAAEPPPAPQQSNNGSNAERDQRESTAEREIKREVIADAIPKVVPFPAQPPVEKAESKTLYFNIWSNVYKNKDLNSQRTWQLPKGTEVTAISQGDSWHAIVTKDGKKGFVKDEVLSVNK